MPYRGRYPRHSRRTAEILLCRRYRHAVAGARTYITDQDSPYSERWGGWYITKPAIDGTLANRVAATGATGKTPELGAIAQPYDPKAYLTPGSDEVALIGAGAPDADAQPDHADQLPHAHRAVQRR